MLTTIAVNGLAVESYGMYPINYDEWISPPGVKYGTADVIGRMGLEPTVAGIAYTPKPLVLGALTPGVALTTDRTSLGAWALALQGQLEIESIDLPGRVCYGYFEQGKGTSLGVQLATPNIQVVGTITCYTPFWFDRSPGTFGGASGSRYLISAGTAPTTIRVWICGPYTNPTLTLRDRTGRVIATMRFTDTAADNSTYLDIVFSKPCRIDRYVSGVRSSVNNGFGLKNSADAFFTIDPLDYSTIETNSGSLAGLSWRSWLL